MTKQYCPGSRPVESPAVDGACRSRGSGGRGSCGAEVARSSATSSRAPTRRSARRVRARPGVTGSSAHAPETRGSACCRAAAATSPWPSIPISSSRRRRPVGVRPDGRRAQRVDPRVAASLAKSDVPQRLADARRAAGDASTCSVRLAGRARCASLRTSTSRSSEHLDRFGAHDATVPGATAQTGVPSGVRRCRCRSGRSSEDRCGTPRTGCCRSKGLTGQPYVQLTAAASRGSCARAVGDGRGAEGTRVRAGRVERERRGDRGGRRGARSPVAAHGGDLPRARTAVQQRPSRGRYVARSAPMARASIRPRNAAACRRLTPVPTARATPPGRRRAGYVQRSARAVRGVARSSLSRRRQTPRDPGQRTAVRRTRAAARTARRPRTGRSRRASAACRRRPARPAGCPRR